MCQLCALKCHTALHNYVQWPCASEHKGAAYPLSTIQPEALKRPSLFRAAATTENRKEQVAPVRNCSPTSTRGCYPDGWEDLLSLRDLGPLTGPAVTGWFNNRKLHQAGKACLWAKGHLMLCAGAFLCNFTDIFGKILWDNHWKNV